MKTINKKAVGGLLIIVILAIGAIGMVFNQPAKAESPIQSLQEQVTTSQKAYDSTFEEAKKAQIKFCKSWKTLAADKKALATETQLPLNSDWDRIATFDCNSLEIPGGF